MRHDRPVAASRREFLALAGSAASLGVAGCLGGGRDLATEGADIPYDVDATRDLSAWSEYDADWTAPTDSPLATPLETEVLVENLEVPWDLSFADGTLFITERVGRVKAFEDGDVRTVAELEEAIDGGSVAPGSDEGSWWVEGGEGGTLGVAAHPAYPDPPLVYVYYTVEDGDDYFNRVRAFDVSADDPNADSWIVVDDIPGEKWHDGGRIEFGPRNKLWITTGDADLRAEAADLGTLGGKVLRVNPDGTAPEDNPSFEDDADPRVFTAGHRNPQGIVWLPDGTPMATEHGPSPGRDEINHLVGGDDYGWHTEDEAVRAPKDYASAGDDVHLPVHNTGREVTWAPTGALFYTGDAVPTLRNRLLIGGLSSQQLIVATVTPEGQELPSTDHGGRTVDADWTDPHYTATIHTTFRNRLGRIRHLEQGPDGGLYVITSNRDGRAEGEFPTEQDDVLARIVPAE